MTGGSTLSWRSANSLTSTASSRASSGGWIEASGRARRRERRSGSGTPARPARCGGEQHRKVALAREIEQVEQRLLVAAVWMSLDDAAPADSDGRNIARAEIPRRSKTDARRRAAATRWRDGSCRSPAARRPRRRQCGQSGQRSTSSTAAALESETRKSSRPAPGDGEARIRVVTATVGMAGVSRLIPSALHRWPR